MESGVQLYGWYKLVGLERGLPFASHIGFVATNIRHAVLHMSHDGHAVAEVSSRILNPRTQVVCCASLWRLSCRSLQARWSSATSLGDGRRSNTSRWVLGFLNASFTPQAGKPGWVPLFLGGGLRSNQALHVLVLLPCYGMSTRHAGRFPRPVFRILKRPTRPS